MANFLVSSLDGKLSLPVKASNAREAAIEAMNTWGSKLKSKVEVKNVKLDPSLNLIRARQEYTCDCCGAKINKGDFYYRKTKTIGNPSKSTFDGVGITHHGFQYTIALCSTAFCGEA